MALQPKPRFAHPPESQQEIDRLERELQEAKDDLKKLQDIHNNIHQLNDNLTRLVNDQNRVIIGLRMQLSLEGKQEQD